MINGIIKILNKELDLSYFGSMIKILYKSILYTFLISYVLWNLIILINPNPDPENFLKESHDINNKTNVSVIKNPIIVFKSYVDFIDNSLRLDFGNVQGTLDSRYTIITDKLLNTFFFLFCGLLTSIFLSIVFLLINKNKKTNRVALFNVGYLHIAIIFLIIDKILLHFNYDINFAPFYLILILSSLIVSLGSGVLNDFYLLLKEEYLNIMSKDYVVFAKDSGLNEHHFALKELIFNLITISISRIPIIFGGLIIIEHKLSDSGLSGISNFILTSIKNADNTSIYVSVLFCILIFSILYFTSEYIQKELIKN